MEHPDVRRDSRMEGVDDLEQPVQDPLPKGRNVLMMVVPGRNERFYEEPEQHPREEDSKRLGCKKHEKIEHEKKRDEENGNPVGLIAEALHRIRG